MRKQLITGLTIHRLTDRRNSDVTYKLNVSSSYNDIRLQNKSWARMVTSRKRISKHMLKKLPVHAIIDDNDGMKTLLLERKLPMIRI